MKVLDKYKSYINKIPEEILCRYKTAQRYLVVNDNDRDLTPISIKLPEQPKPHLIDNFGLPAEEQVWKPQKMPIKLKKLSKSKETIDEIWDVLNTNQYYYREEIKWIEKQWYHRLYGYWFYNNGIPTYIDGWHWFYIAYWHLDVGLPKYRSRDRKFFIFARYC